MTPFRLERDEDVSGVSGTGCVAQGVVFDDGTVALRWLTEHRSTVLYGDLETARQIHGHDGKTRIVLGKSTDQDQDPAAVCFCCGHPLKDHWGDNCGGCQVGTCMCVSMQHEHMRCPTRKYGDPPGAPAKEAPP